MHPNHIWILGNHPLLSLAELLATKTLNSEQIVGLSQSCLLSKHQSIKQDLNNLGGIIKQGEIFANFLQAEAQDIDSIASKLADHLAQHKATKITFGISQPPEMQIDIPNLIKLIKKHLDQNSIKARYILASPGHQINSAQIKKNELLIKPNADILLTSDQSTIYLGRTNWYQDIDAYQQRDENRPHRLHQEGMLPVKLAQIMINLAGPVDPGSLILDPFCGSGTILQEALLLGYDVIGSDISAATLQKCRTNLDWFANRFSKFGQTDKRPFYQLLLQPAQKIGTSFAKNSFRAIVSEGYLGKLYTKEPPPKELSDQANQLASIYLGFLKSAYPLLQPDGRLVISFPYYLNSGLAVLALIIDDIIKIGYNLQSLVPDEVMAIGSIDPVIKTAIPSYIYSRTGQIVGRQIVVLSK